MYKNHELLKRGNTVTYKWTLLSDYQVITN